MIDLPIETEDTIESLANTYEYILKVHFDAYSDVYNKKDVDELFDTHFKDAKEKFDYMYYLIKQLLNKNASHGILIESEQRCVFIFPDNEVPYVVDFDKFIVDNPDQKDNWKNGGFFRNTLAIN